MGKEMEIRKRYYWMDLLNILAICGVIILHTNNYFVHHYDGEMSISKGWNILTHSLFIWPVPVFFMLSGANLMSGSTDNMGGVFP